MKLDCLRTFLLPVILVFVISAARAGDLKVVSAVRFQNGDTYTTARYYHGERMRIESREHATWKPGLVTYGPPTATIYQCDAQRVINLNLESHQYAITELNEECQSKSLPPRSGPKGTMDVYIESADTGERQQILGQTARHIITHQRQVAGPQACWRDGETDLDGWYIDMKEQKVAQKLRRHSAEELADVIMTGAGCWDKLEVHRTGVEKPGFPLKLVKTLRASSLQPDGTSKEFTTHWEVEVTELSEAPLDASLFDLPGGFTKVARINGRPDVPFSVAIENWWYRAVREVRSWF